MVSDAREGPGDIGFTCACPPFISFFSRARRRSRLIGFVCGYTVDGDGSAVDRSGNQDAGTPGCQAVTRGSFLEMYRRTGSREWLPLLFLVERKADAVQHTHTLRLSANNLRDLRTLAGLPKWLPHIRALDLSDNTDLNKLGMLDVLSTLSCLSSAKENGVKVGSDVVTYRVLALMDE